MKTDHEYQDAPPQAVSRLGLYLPSGLLLALAMGWSGFWFYAARQAQDGLNQWKAAEAAAGRKWDCAQQDIGGFPFRLELTCASVSLADTANGKTTRVSTGALHAATQLYSPKLALADVSGPLKIESDGRATQADWDAMRVSVRFADRLQRLSIAATQPRLNAGAETDMVWARAKAAELHLRYDVERPAQDRAVDVALNLTEARIPAADALTGGAEPLNLDLSGAVTKALDIAPQGWRNALESWRRADGAFVIDQGKAKKGALEIEGKGVMKLDEAHRLQGELDVAAKGVGPLVARFGAGNMQQLVTSLFQKKDGGAVQWPVRFQDGRIQMGPLRSGPILSPLY